MSTGPEQPPAARTALSRPAIVAAALQLVSEHGLDALSLRRLASDLGVTAPALYAHVRDKSDLLATLAETGFRELLDRYAAIATDDPIDRIRRQCLIYVDMALANPGLFQAMFMFPPQALELPNPRTELAAATEAFEQPTKAIADAIATGAIHPDHDPFVAALTLWTVTHGLAQVLLLGVSADADARRDLQEAVLGATFRGLALPPA